MTGLRLAMAAIAVSLTACGGGGGSGDSDKNLFSLWHEVETDKPLDLTGGAFSTPMSMSTFFAGGAICTCELTVLGEQSSGAYVMSYCTYSYGSGSGDPGCNALNDTGNYKKTSDTLTITPSSGSASVYK